MQIGSYKRFSTTRNDYGYFTPIDIDLSFDSLDRAILQLETLYITSYAWRTYSDSILNTDTLIDSTGDRVRERYYVGKSIDKGYLPDPGSEETDHLARGMRKASDVLAIVEFYLNRVHSLSRDNIKDQMVVARRYIRSRWKAASGQTKSGKKDGSEFDVGQLKTITKYSKDENDHQNATFSFNSKSEPQFIRETLEGKVDGAYPLAQFDRIGLRWVEKDGELVAVPLETQPLYAIDSPPDTLHFADLFLKIPTAEEPNPFLDEMCERFWKSVLNANYSGVVLNGKNGSYLPMTYVVDHVVQTLKALEKENPSHPFLYCMDKDVTDIRRGNIYPLDVFLGPRLSNDSGPQVTESRVDRIIQAKGGERYVTDIVYYARVMHSVLLDSRFENDHLVFRFSEDVLLRLADPRLLDRSYPPRLVFTPKMKAAYGSYLKSLKGNGYANDEKDSCEWIFKRGNVPIHVAPAWSVPAMRSRMLRDRRDSYSELYLRLLEAERKKKTSPRTKEPPEPFDPRNEPRSSYILVRTPQEEDYCADLVCGLAEREVLSHIVVFGNERNWRVRHDLFDMIEVGVTSITQIYEMQRNDLDRQRTEAYRILESYLDVVLPTRPKAGDLVTSALYELEDLCGRQIASDAKFRIV